ncbi:WD40-repeat-containing domain protein [Phlebopus sp. FC_14]|nr:WD40-repeat-containing domain protein [Phlebopus sp. FC_14]
MHAGEGAPPGCRIAPEGLTGDAGLMQVLPLNPIDLVQKLREVGRSGSSTAVRTARGMQETAGQSWSIAAVQSIGRMNVSFLNHRHLAFVGKMGHVATFDWQTGTIHAELQLQETCRDITFLQDQSFFAVAQKKYVFTYDRDGVELHRLKAHIEPTRLEFLPYHWLLASIGNTGYLKYQDTSTGVLSQNTAQKPGPNGVVSLWTPNLPHPAVQLLAHLGPVVGLSVDPSTGGRYMATSGADGTVKVWDCRNWKGAVREWTTRGGGAEVEWSAKGALAVATGGSVNVYTKPSIQAPFAAKASPPLYLTHPIPHRPLTSVRFCAFQDILTIGHNAGLSSILVPGSGEPNFDSMEADHLKTRERGGSARSRIQPDMIALDPDFVGSLAPPTRLTTAGKGDRTVLDGAVDDGDNDNENEGVDNNGKEEPRKMRG